MADTDQHAPIDAELLETLLPSVVEAGVGFNMTLDKIPWLRETYLPTLPNDEVLRRRGTVELEELSVPVSAGGPELRR